MISMARLLPYLLLIAFLGTLGWTGVYLYEKSEVKPEVIETGAPVVGDVIQKTVATGSIVPRKEIEIKARVSGILDELVVEPGQHVKKGDLVARIRVVPNISELQRAQAGVRQAKLRLENARIELERQRSLNAQGIVANSAVTPLQYERDLRKQELADAEESLELVLEGASRAAREAGVATNEVRSTVDGMVLDVPEKEGASIIESNTFNPGSTLAVVADMSDMIYLGQIDESEVGKIRKGMSLDVRIGALQNQRFRAVLEYIAPKGNLLEGAIQFEIRAAMQLQEGTFLRSGYSANADIVLDQRHEVLTVDESLLMFENGEPFVEVEVQPDRFERRAVELGLSDGIRVEVLSGIAAVDVLRKPKAGEATGTAVERD